MLQWGPGRMPGKTCCPFPGSEPEAAASMGPRQDAGEDGFPSIVPGKSIFLLQWGPGRMPGKTNHDSRWSCVRQWLQWGPGRMPGKTRSSPIICVPLHELQWGPGRMPGKTHGKSCQIHCTRFCFNGAPAGCRGRLAGKIFSGIIHAASMGPRQDAGEDPRWVLMDTLHPMASMGPRQDAGEDNNTEYILPLEYGASMGPRQDAGEDGNL